VAASAADKYLTVRESGATGFWRGLAVGVVLCLLAFGALVVLYPPTVYPPPSLAPEAALPPADIGLPGDVTLPPAAPLRARPLLVEAPAPLISTLPQRDTPPGFDALRLPAAPDVFDGGPAGSPSLFDPASEPAKTPELR
jgi:hypothetical protein